MKEKSLEQYVLDYLKEEIKRGKLIHRDQWDAHDIELVVRQAIDAYEGGAR